MENITSININQIKLKIMKNVTTVFQSKLAAAESSYNSAFGVISNIQSSAEAAEKAAQNEADKAQLKKLEYQTKEILMKSKVAVYKNRAEKIAAFIDNLSD